MEKEYASRIVSVEKDLCITQAIAIDFGAGRIRNERMTDHAAGDPLAFQLFAELTEIDGDKIVGLAIDRRLERTMRSATTVQFGFVIAGEEALARWPLADGEGNEIGLEPMPDLSGIVRRRNVAADIHPVASMACITIARHCGGRRRKKKLSAGAFERGERGTRIAAGPSGEFAETRSR